MARHASLAPAVFLASFLAVALAFAGQQIAPLGGLKLPLPVPADAFGLEHNPDTGHLAYPSASGFRDPTSYYRDLLKADGLTEKDPLIETGNQETPAFAKSDGSLVFNISSSGRSTDFVSKSAGIAHMGDAIEAMPMLAATLSGMKASAAMSGAPKTDDNFIVADASATGGAAKPPLPMPDDAEDVVFEGESGVLTFSTAKPVKELADFYRALGKKQGWQEEPSVINQDNMAVLTFMVNGDDVATITVMKMGEKSQVTAEGTALEAKGGVDDQAKSADEGTSGNSDAPATAPLVAIDKDGLPIPDGLGNMGATRTMYSHAVNFSAPNSVAEIVAFYRTELGKRGWKEDAAKVSDSAAELAFTAPDGPAKLIVTRNGDTSDAELTVNDKASAAKSPLAPKPGMVKLVFGNMTDKAADVAIAGKHVKLAAKQGSAGPDGPTLDVPPGKLTAQIKGAKESFTAGPDEIWMVGVGPGGLIAIKQ